jgi:hypothetical protein
VIKPSFLINAERVITPSALKRLSRFFGTKGNFSFQEMLPTSALPAKKIGKKKGVDPKANALHRYYPLIRRKEKCPLYTMKL